MNRFFFVLVICAALSLTLAKCGCELAASKRDTQHQCACVSRPYCPPCNPKAGCRIWGCPCYHDGFIMYPGNESLNAPRPAACPKCVSQCDNLAIKCRYPYLNCTAEQVASYKCIELIDEDVL